MNCIYVYMFVQWLDKVKQKRYGKTVPKNGGNKMEKNISNATAAAEATTTETAVVKRPQEWIVNASAFTITAEKGRTANGLIGRVVKLEDGREAVWSEAQILRHEKAAFKAAVDGRYFREASSAALDMAAGECRRFSIEIPAVDMAGKIRWGNELFPLAAMRLAYGARALQQGALVRLSAPTAERRPDGSAVVAFDATKMPRRKAFELRKADGAGLAGLIEEFKKLL